MEITKLKTLTVLCCLLATSVCNAQNLTGSGTESEPYLISTQSDLKIFANNVNSGISYDGKFIKLNDNIECDYNEDIQWTPIGDDNNSFQGTFDGNGKTISGLYFNDENTEFVGLFGYIGSGATVQNVGVVDSYFKGYQGVGGVVGYNYNGTVSNVYNTGSVNGEQEIGGVVGWNYGGTVSNAYNTGSVNGKKEVGGVVGYNFYGTVSNVYNTGSVDGSFRVGGVVGDGYGGEITNCYYLSDADNGNDAKTQGQFANGEVAYKLGGAFFQTIGEDASPVLNSTHGVVYQTTGCSRIPYSNTENDFIEHINFDANGFCSVCGGGYEPAKYSDENGVYEIANAGNLYWFANFVNQGNFTANAILTDDIVVNTLEFADGEIVTDGKDYRVWSPIGYGSSYYQGTFNGNGHTISGLYFNISNQCNVGLFGQITGNAVIKNVGVIDSYFKGDVGVGGVCGDNDDQKGLIENCYNASIVIGNDYVGGVCGDNSGTIKNCYNTGGIEGHHSYTGGVCGFSETTIINCYNIGDIEGYYDTGGVCGSNESLIKNCYNIGEVNGDEKTGGVCGYNNYGTIQYCHNVGMVNSKHYYIGGVCGYNSYGTIRHCYFNSDIYQGDASDGDDTDETVAGKSSADFKNLVIGLLNVNGNNVWGQGLSYPMLISNHVHEYSNGFCMVCNVCQQPEQDENGVYEIANAGNLYWFANYVNQGGENLNAKLIADICVNGCGEGEKSLLEQVAELEAKDELSPESFQQWTPMNVSNAMTVAFDGNGHTISGLYFNKETSSQIGLFGQVVGDVSVSNLGVVDFYVNGNGEVGSLAGQVTGKLNIKNCYSAGSVKGVHYVGGIVGVNRDGAELKIENSYNESSVNAPSGIVGGLVGENYNYASLTITNSYNVGAVSGTQYVGGLVGDNYTYAILTIENSYNVGTVSGTQYVGGLVGVNEVGTLNVSNSFFVETNGDGDGLAGEAKTSDEFANGTVTDLLNTGQSPVVWVQGKEYPILKDNHIHSYENGFCACGNYVQPVQDENDVYQIANAGNLYWFAEYVNQGGENSNANAILVNNIVVNTEVLVDGELNTNKTFREWTPIGISYDNSYKGTFDGNEKTISGLYFDNSDQDYVGLFGCIIEGTIKNVGVVDSYFHGKEYVGGVCGHNTECNIENCYNTGAVNGSNDVGGVSGCNTYGTISNCYNTGAVNGSTNVGGVSNSDFAGTFTNCYNTGEVNGVYSVGGVCGTVGSYCTIANCYNIGEVNGSGDNVGGVRGNYNSWSTATNCYYLSDTDTSDGDGVYGKTAEQFADGTVAKLLFTADSIWGQNTSTDTIPNFSGKIIFTVSVTASDNGTVSGASGEYEYNSQLVFVATPNEGYHFVEWSNGSTKTNDTILVVSDTALVATFTAHEFGKWDTIQAATCTEYGLRVHTCSCGAFDIDTIPALGHSFTNYIYNNDATIEADGTETATCDHEGCHATDTRIAEGTKLGAAVNDLETENIHIYAHNYTIVVEHAANDIIVYDAKGQLITHRTVTGNSTEQINVINSGIYIVKCGNTTKCVICN